MNNIDIKSLTKLYYSIGEVSALFGVNTSLIRFWEKEFENIQPQKNKKGNRIYTESDLKTLHTIKYLVKDRGFTLEGAKKKLKDNPKDLEEKADLVRSLENVKSMLIELKDSL